MIHLKLLTIAMKTSHVQIAQGDLEQLKVVLLAS